MAHDDHIADSIGQDKTIQPAGRGQAARQRGERDVAVRASPVLYWLVCFVLVTFTGLGFCGLGSLIFGLTALATGSDNVELITAWGGLVSGLCVAGLVFWLFRRKYAGHRIVAIEEASSSFAPV